MSALDRRAFVKMALAGAAGAVSPAWAPRRADTGSGPGILKLLTWNIWMMPPWTLQSPRNTARAEAIATALLGQDVDILCLQKVFDEDARRALHEALHPTYPYDYGPANAGPGLRLHSGVWVLSRRPLSLEAEIEFQDRAGVEFFARKGAMLLRGRSEEQAFQLVATHLQGDDTSGYSAAKQAVRDRQMAQLDSELVRPRSEPGVPMFLCGDFSTPRRAPESPTAESESYREMLRRFDADNGPAYRITLNDDRCWNDIAADDTGRTDELDYVLVRANGARLRAEWVQLILRRRGWDGPEGRQDLSYRYAVTATIQFL